MQYERFIAGRYLRSGRFFTSVSTWITALGVMLGVAVVCFVMSMHNGFETELRTRLLGTTSHITIFPRNPEMISDYRNIIEKVEAIEDVVAASPFIYYKAAISSESAGDGIVVRGIDLEMERLHKSCRRLIWLNPLLRFEGFEPKSQGIRAIMPHVDEFRPVHNLESLTELVEALNRQLIRRQEGMSEWLEAM